MRFIQYILSHPQLIIAFLVIVGPVLSAIFRKLKEQSQARQIEIARERARIEALRTGGRSEDQVLTANADGARIAMPSPAAATQTPVATATNRAATARATLEELAAKRRAELLGQSIPTPTAPERPRNVRETGRQPPLPANAGPAARADQERQKQAQRQGEQRQRDQKQQQREQGRRDQQRAASKQADVERAQGVRTGSMRQEQATREPVRQQPRRPEPVPNENAEGPATLMDRGQFKRDEAAAAANVVAAAEAGKRSRATWRRAMIMQELLAQPVSIRRPQE